MNNSRKKILYVITKGNFGGAQRYVFDLATNIPKDEFESIVAFGEGDTLGIKLKDAGIRTIRISSLKRNVGIVSDFISFFALLRIIQKEKPRVVHLNSSKVGLIGSIVIRVLNLTKSKKIKIIFTAHGWAFNEERGIISKFILKTLHWFTILLSHKTIAVSKRTADQISHLPWMKRKIGVIYNGIDAFNLLPRTEARSILAPQTSEHTWIGTIAELHQSKGLDYLIKAFAEITKKYANVVLVIIGSGEQEKKLKALTQSLEISNKIIFTGFKADARIYLSAFDIFTLTSRTEAFPYAPLEAGFASLPIVASWVGGIPEIITNQVSGILIDPSVTEELTSALDTLIADPSYRTALGTTLHDSISHKFTLEKMVAQTKTLY